MESLDGSVGRIEAYTKVFKNRFAAVLNWTVALLGRGRRQRTISEQCC
ncbi:MAG TPA: hypothetical protein VGK55_09720 [Actinomycetes bacterium]